MIFVKKMIKMTIWGHPLTKMVRGCFCAYKETENMEKVAGFVYTGGRSGFIRVSGTAVFHTWHRMFCAGL